jgi:DNA repair protein RecN (Recombination protein N)
VLEELHVKDLALIEDAWLEFGTGMTVLTGETGAGKTALLSALKLLLGERADSGAVRPGAREALVEGRMLLGEGELVASRSVSAEGRSKIRLDGTMATVGELAAAMGPHVDLHGQHEHQALLSAATHLGYLDRWAAARIAGLKDAYREAFLSFT